MEIRNYYRNQQFLEDGELKVQLFGRGFAWLIRTLDSLSEASTFIEVLENDKVENFLFRRDCLA